MSSTEPTPPPTTIRLQNRTPGNLSLYLHKYRTNTGGSLRRGVQLTPVLIKCGAYYDVCKELEVDYVDAGRIIASSPQVIDFERKGYLTQIVYPAPIVVPTPAPAPAPTPAPAPAPTQTRAPTRADEQLLLALVQADEEALLAKPLVTSEALQPMMMVPAPATQQSEPAGLPDVDVSDAELEALTAPSADAAARAVGEAPRLLKQPSMDWPENELRDYARARGIDVTNVRSKTAVLKMIRERS